MKTSLSWCRVALLSLFVGLLGGCSGKREVTGQVFVVTKGGENVKLGLVGIHVVGEQQMREIATRLLGEAATNRVERDYLAALSSEFRGWVREAPEAQATPLKRLAEDVSRRANARDLSEQLGGSITERLMGRMPAAVTQTDADGVFVVEAGPGDWMVARGQRQTGGSTENYLWLISLKGVERKLLVSNDRVLDDDELLKALAGITPMGPDPSPDTALVAWADKKRKEGKVALAEANAAEARALAEARAKAEAEEKERQRLAAEARAKAEAAEIALATKLGLSRPFAAGLRGQAGDVAVRWIPAGRFRMGSPSGEEGRFSDEVAHEVVLSRGFFMGETECTQGQWEAVMGSNPSRFKGGDRPVEQVSWEEAVEYCRKLTAQQRAGGILPEGWAWRLPTEAEWEYAARAGTTGARHGELDTIAWYDGNSGSETHAVKGKQANAWGLHDMMGNVWEWCSDWYGEYPTGEVTDPTGAGSGSSRVLRGGSWYFDAWFVRSADRHRLDPGFRVSGLGFRPALSSVR